MKPIILILTFVVSFSLTSMAVAQGGVMGMVPDADNTPALSELSEKVSDGICKVVGANGMKAQRNKNTGVSQEDSISQLTRAFEMGSDQGDPVDVALNISLGAVNAVYAESLPVSTDEEFAALGLTIYNICRMTVDQIEWEVTE